MMGESPIAAEPLVGHAAGGRGGGQSAVLVERDGADGAKVGGVDGFEPGLGLMGLLGQSFFKGLLALGGVEVGVLDERQFLIAGEGIGTWTGRAGRAGSGPSRPWRR